MKLIIMITSPTQQRKTKPAHWKLADVHAQLDCRNYVFSSAAQRDYTNLGMTGKKASELVRSLTDNEFEWCYIYPDGVIHDSYKSRFTWYDANDEIERNDTIFVKLCMSGKGKLVIERFHLDGRL
jgi:hypothetical protein